ncbi:hypothetical protein C7Y72_05585 [Paraconexibacter algicola]|uniref:Uncharacterized protein n=2 Tax=Paraconexibacter algicola TaxID=2133960 RepID=A0A2T4UIW8_9ACTN|nr:hypothetical protein C7Y72_05585 [Paraconexibacter algicola]
MMETTGPQPRPRVRLSPEYLRKRGLRPQRLPPKPPPVEVEGDEHDVEEIGRDAPVPTPVKPFDLFEHLPDGTQRDPGLIGFRTSAAPELPRVDGFDRMVTIKGTSKSSTKAARKALESFHAAGSDLAKREGHIAKFIDATRTLAAKDEQAAKKKPGGPNASRAVVLRDLCGRAAGVYKLIKRARYSIEMPEGRERVRAIQDIVDESLLLDDGGYGSTPLTFIREPLTRLVFKWGLENASSADGQSVVADDTARLNKMANSGVLPDILERTIRDGLANASRTTYIASGAGATRDPMADEFTVKGGLMASGGLGQLERTASRLHELVHVLVSRAYDNTAMLFAIDRDASAEEVERRCRERVAMSRELENRITSEPTLRPTQRKQLLDKTKYGAVDQKLDHYIGTFVENNVSEAELARAWHVRCLVAGHADHTVLVAADRGPNALVEWDSTCAQMLLWCVAWSLPETSPVLQQLILMATKAHDDRAAATATAASSKPYPVTEFALPDKLKPKTTPPN